MYDVECKNSSFGTGIGAYGTVLEPHSTRFGIGPLDGMGCFAAEALQCGVENDWCCCVAVLQLFLSLLQ
jgi:hypothetical protein